MTDPEYTRAYVIEIAVKRHIKNGLTPEAARVRVEECIDAPWCIELPSFEDFANGSTASPDEA